MQLKEKSALIRHILKTISYRMLGTLTTVTTAYLLGVSLELSSILGIVELIVKPLIYFIHERFWYKNIRLYETSKSESITKLESKREFTSLYSKEE